MSVIETERLTKRYGSQRGIDDVTVSVEAGEVFGLLGPNGAGKTTLIRTLLDLLHPTSGSARLFGLDSRRDSLAIRRRLGLQALFHQPELLIFDEPTSGLDPLMQEQFLAVAGEQRERGATVLLSSHDLDEVERVCDRVGIIRDGRLIAVERVSELVGKSYRHVSLAFAEPTDAAGFAALPGVSDVSSQDGRISFEVAGELDPVIKAAARHSVRDMQIAHPTLEEVFLTYYADGEER